jgi:low affinity Fe/Cu permease
MRDEGRSVTQVVRPQVDAPSREQATLRRRAYQLFGEFANKVAAVVGSPWAFLAAAATIVVWGVSGPAFHYSDSWQLVINTGTTIVTFLMVFLIQSTQNRDAEAVQIKLDELLRATTGAHNALLDLEELEERELDSVHEVYCKLAEKARKDLRRGIRDTGSPELPHIPGKELRG